MARKLPTVPTAVAGSMAESPSGITWREQHPVIPQEGHFESELVLFCPEGALCYENGKLSVNHQLCKGCGICANECQDIKMAPEYKGPHGLIR